MPELIELTDELVSSLTGVETLSHYNGEVTVYYHDGYHIYYTDEDGVKLLVPGSSSVCGTLDKSGALTWWAANETVKAFIAGLPVSDGERAHMLAYFQRLRDKCPWDDAECGPVVDITLSSRDIVDRLNTARYAFRAIKEDAADVGTAAHLWLENHIKGLLFGDPDVCMCGDYRKNHSYSTGHDFVSQTDQIMPAEPRARNCVQHGLEWMERHKFRPFCSEKKIYSRGYGYSGTLDFLGEVTACGDGKCCPFYGTHVELGDFKSSNSLHMEYFLQTASYQHAHLEEFPDQPIEARRLLRLGKEEGDFESVYRGNEYFEFDMDGFVGLLAAYHWQQQMNLEKKYEKALAKASKPKTKRRAPKRAVVKTVDPKDTGLIQCESEVAA